MDPKDIGEMILYHRKKSGLSRNQLAKLAGVGKTAVFDVEKGKLSLRLTTLLKILHVLNITMHFTGPYMKGFINEKS